MDEQQGGDEERSEATLSSLSLGVRLTIVSAVAVALAVAIASVGAYVIVRAQLVKQLDQSLVEQLAAGIHIDHGGPTSRRGTSRRSAFPATSRSRRSDGTMQLSSGEQVHLPVTPETLDTARGGREAYFSNATVRGIHLRILTAPGHTETGQTVAIQIARPLSEVDHVAPPPADPAVPDHARRAPGSRPSSGWAWHGRALRPFAASPTPSSRSRPRATCRSRIDVTSDDEIGRLSARFDEMLDAIQALQSAQRQLVADASHELRTPLTSLRTNIEVLARGEGLSAAEREHLLHDVVAELEDLSVARRRPHRAGPRQLGRRDARGRPPGRGGRAGGRAGAPARPRARLPRRPAAHRRARLGRRASTGPSATCSTTPRSGARPAAWSR